MKKLYYKKSKRELLSYRMGRRRNMYIKRCRIFPTYVKPIFPELEGDLS